MDDWRLNGQDKYLFGVNLKKISFSDKSTDTEHEHCEFCFEKISNYNSTVNEAFCTEDEYYWICETCYEDFKNMFEWQFANK